ncbi:Dual-specificity RNA methyltransferase RlmN [uncultured archaeon]|nr:Dual-specificity RNA methyltransferase RlmN [uncultured archaeon]
MKEIIINSKTDPLKKITFEDKHGKHFYTVSFYDAKVNSINLCVSSQVGCIEKCAFCATGDAPFVRNLTKNEITEQINSGILAMKKLILDKKPEDLFILIEGMGEASYNLKNCINGFLSFKRKKSRFRRIVFRISSAGNLNLIKPYKEMVLKNKKNMPEVEFRIQLSLHSPYDKERAMLIPNLGKKYKIEEILPKFKELADFFGKKLKINYMLLNFPSGKNNYSKKHIKKLISLAKKFDAEVKLTKYSENIGKAFSSPPDKKYAEIMKLMNSKGIMTTIRDLLGSDIDAACGMLDYRTKLN